MVNESESIIERQRTEIIEDFKKTNESLYNQIIEALNTPNNIAQYEIKVIYSGTGESYGE